ncbi:MAG TPA: polyhydroxyalkanoic acid system family protein [Beijerinckiaceae bacterium]|nr:polyhydroxyalkanoic acid system family protein [Beijerinckiaceae bacterium]
MSKPVVVSIPHQLGKEEAQRRLQGGVGRLRAQFGDKLGTIEDTWTGDHADFRLSVLGQGVSGSLDVMEDHVRVEVQLPWMLAMVAEKAKGLIQKQGTLMLEKK